MRRTCGATSSPNACHSYAEHSSRGSVDYERGETLNQLVDRFHLLQVRLERLQRQGARFVAQRVVWLGMRFEKQAGYTKRHSSARLRRTLRAPTIGTATAPARFLKSVSRIEYDGRH